ncbi:MAG: right-handed parallel beta-helix repeat-containing protein [Myxococcaceae bacterium]
MALLCIGQLANAATIPITPASSFTDIEAATAGDEVVIAPGTYKFRVFLGNEGTAAAPIHLRAQDPSNPPIWDLTGQDPADWPGSYTGGDNGRGCWQVRGSHYVIENIVFKGCKAVTSGTSAGIRVVNATDVTVRGCSFSACDNGVETVAPDLTVEFCEFHQNLQSSIASYGGTLTARWNLMTDSGSSHLYLGGGSVTLEYNWMSRWGDYAIHFGYCEEFCGGTSLADPISKVLTMTGNVMVAGPASVNDRIVTLYASQAESTDGTGTLSVLEARFVNNTIIGTAVNAGGLAFLLIANQPGAVQHKVTFMNNALVGVAAAYTENVPGNADYLVRGENNWLPTGADFGALTGTLQGASPGFEDESAMDFRPNVSSELRNHAALVTPPLEAPVSEYYRDEIVAALARTRQKVADIGAFEYGNDAAPVGSASGALEPKHLGVGCQVAGGDAAIAWMVLAAVQRGRRRTREARR